MGEEISKRKPWWKRISFVLPAVALVGLLVGGEIAHERHELGELHDQIQNVTTARREYMANGKVLGGTPALRPAQPVGRHSSTICLKHTHDEVHENEIVCAEEADLDSVLSHVRRTSGRDSVTDTTFALIMTLPKR